MRCLHLLMIVVMTLSPLAFAQTTQAQFSSEDAARKIADPPSETRLNLPVPKNPALPTLWLVGDSTVRNGHGDGAGGMWGWGEPLVDLFDPSKINVVNRAIGGLSSRTYITGGHWERTLSMMKRGDFVLIQFGHNDGGTPELQRLRGSLAGVGDDTQQVDVAKSGQPSQMETVHSFGWYLRKYVDDAQVKGVTVILCTLIPRKIWDGTHIVRNADTYAGWTRQVAEQKHIGLIDLNEIIAREYDALGQPAVEPMFGDPHTHTSMAGAKLNAKAVVTGLKLLHPDPLAADFSADGQAVSGAMPSAR